MKQKLYMAVAAMTAMAIYSCDEETATIGQSVTNTNDQLVVTATTYEA